MEGIQQKINITIANFVEIITLSATITCKAVWKIRNIARRASSLRLVTDVR